MHHRPSMSNHLSIMSNRHLHPSLFWPFFILPSITPFSILHLPVLHHPFFHLYCSVIILPSSIAPLCQIVPLYPIIAPLSILPMLHDFNLLSTLIASLSLSFSLSVGQHVSPRRQRGSSRRLFAVWKGWRRLHILRIFHNMSKWPLENNGYSLFL